MKIGIVEIRCLGSLCQIKWIQTVKNLSLIQKGRGYIMMELKYKILYRVLNIYPVLYSVYI